jgi:integrase
LQNACKWSYFRYDAFPYISEYLSGLLHGCCTTLMKAGLYSFTFHSLLRHTFGCSFHAKRVVPKIAQSLLGHSSITQTMDTHSHLMGSLGGDAVGGLDEAFD